MTVDKDSRGRDAPDPDYSCIGLTVGLEIHQQLDTGRKLFCSCGTGEAQEFTVEFSRRLRASKSEMGGYDPAAAFEEAKSKTITYRADSGSSCLLEEDEEPPHDVDRVAKETALIVSASLNSKIFKEIFTMRKIVIDGSNTSGFQRTMLVAQGGAVRVGKTDVGVQSVCLEEDAARLLSDSRARREYALDRLGVPLIEIALEPVRAGPRQMREIALALGRLLRATGRVARGLGSIRQDVNVSVTGGGVVEVKGVQQLDQLEKVIKFEARRQADLMEISRRLRDLGECRIDGASADITEEMRACNSKIIRSAIQEERRIYAVCIPGFAGFFSLSPSGGTRLGREVAQLVKSYGVGGIFHSDELPKYGITESDLSVVRERVGAGEEDGFLIVALPPHLRDVLPERILARIRTAWKGVPAETRQATSDGQTAFLRPRPGPARMYPETDVPPIILTKDELEEAARSVPKPWEETVADLQSKHGLNPQLAEQILDSGRLGLFEGIVGERGVEPNFVASSLCSTVTSLQRKGLDASRLTDDIAKRSFELLAGGEIAKESIEVIFESVMAGRTETADEAVRRSLAGGMDETQLAMLLDDIVRDNSELISRQKERSMGPLMGEVMKRARGRVSGEKISRFLRARIARELKDGKN